MRGGGWNTNAPHVRAPNRNNNAPANRNDNIGFRCAKTPHLDGSREARVPAVYGWRERASWSLAVWSCVSGYVLQELSSPEAKKSHACPWLVGPRGRTSGAGPVPISAVTNSSSSFPEPCMDETSYCNLLGWHDGGKPVHEVVITSDHTQTLAARLSALEAMIRTLQEHSSTFQESLHQLCNGARRYGPLCRSRASN